MDNTNQRRVLFKKLSKSTGIQLYTDTYTITFGDQAENHVGMQKIGTLSKEGFTMKDLHEIGSRFPKSELYNLSSDDSLPEAGILILRNAVTTLLSSGTDHDMYTEQSKITYDKKALMRGKVVNKHARHNVCFDMKSQEPDYPNGKGRIIAYDDTPILKDLRNNMVKYFGMKASGLVAEGNHYYDPSKCYIGWHGDSERRKVIAIRLGATMDLQYQWYHNSKPVGDIMKFLLNHGDMYVMSEKAVGYDWKKRSIPTLRHSAGCK